MNRGMNIPYEYKQDSSVREDSALATGRKKTKERLKFKLRTRLLRQWGGNEERI